MADCTEPMPWPVDASGTHWPRVYIIILSWNGKEDTLRCLRSVQEVDYPRYRVLVVDNASSDGSVAAIRDAFPAAELIINKSNLGFSAGNNEGIQYALHRGADYVFLLNNDTRVDRLVLRGLVSAGEADPGVGLASPKVYYLDHPQDIYYEGARKGWLPLVPRLIDQARSATAEERGQVGQPQEVDYVWGQAMFIKRQVVESVGLLDPQFFMYYEDIDYCLRAKKGGYKMVCVPEAVVWHQVAKGTQGDYLTRWQYKVTSMWRFHRKHSRLGWPQALLLTILTMGWITLRELGRGNWRPLPQMARSWIERRRQG